MKKIDYKKSYVFLLSFFIPMVIFFGGLYFAGNYPFGDRSLAIWDMKLQYLDFFSWLKRVFNGEAGLFYSFGKSLGDNTIGLVAYYLASPFNLLLFFFDDILLFTVVITALKIASCGLTCAIFLRKRFQDMGCGWSVLLAVSYGLMAYNLDQSSNIMWLDGAVCLPLILLGTYRMIRSERKLLLYLSVAVAILSNWYTAYMCCLFSAFYYLYEKVLAENFCIKQFVHRYIIPFMKYCGVMLLSVFSTMILFLPNIINLLQGKGISGKGNFFMKFRCGWKEILEGLMPGNVEVINTSVLILYCGGFVVLGILGYFIFGKINLKKKMWSGILGTFLIVSAVLIPLENVWNGFRKVASYYCRFSFVICFFMIYLAACFFSSLKKTKGYKIVSWICCFAAIVDLSYNTYTVMDKKLCVEKASDYNNYAKEAIQQIECLQEYDSDVFYRTEQTLSRGIRQGNYAGTYNEGMAYGFNPLASYSSTYNSLIMNFYVNCGYSECKRLIMYHEPMLVSDSILGIKYVLSQEKPFGYEEIGEIPVFNQKKTFRNPYALGLGYPVEAGFREEIDAENSFEYQNQLISNILGKEVKCYKPAEAKLVQEEGQWTWIIEGPECNHILYGYLTRRGANDVDVYIDDEFRTDYSQWTSYKTFQISEDTTRQLHTVSMRGDIVNQQGIEGVFYYLDMQAFEQTMNELRKNEFRPDVFKDGLIEGNYQSEKDGYLLLTVPYDNGWQVTCNGKRVEPEIVYGIFTALPVQAGENSIRLRYITPGVKAGGAVTIISILIFSVWCILERRKTRKNQS